MPRTLKPDSEISRSAAKLRLLKRLKCTLRFEKLAWASGAQLVCGVDEVGRGAFFGPVVAGAVILDPKYRIKGLRDSKLLPAARREVLAERIKERCIAWAVAEVDAAHIDEINIYQASLLAMVRAIEQLNPKPDHLLLDAVRVSYDCPQTKIIHGDALSASIAAASIVAKVYRDALITRLADSYPGYDLASNKGYRSPKHIASLNQLGPTPLHRQSFAPVWMAAHPQEVLAFMMSENAEDALKNDMTGATVETN